MGILLLGLVCTVSVNKSPDAEDVIPIGEIVRVYATAIDMDAGEPFDMTKIKIIEIAETQVDGLNVVKNIGLIRGQFAAERLTVDSPITTDLLSTTESIIATPAVAEDRFGRGRAFRQFPSAFDLDQHFRLALLACNSPKDINRKAFKPRSSFREMPVELAQEFVAFG